MIPSGSIDITCKLLAFHKSLRNMPYDAVTMDWLKGSIRSCREVEYGRGLCSKINDTGRCPLSQILLANRKLSSSQPSKGGNVGGGTRFAG